MLVIARAPALLPHAIVSLARLLVVKEDSGTAFLVVVSLVRMVRVPPVAKVVKVLFVRKIRISRMTRAYRPAPTWVLSLVL